MLPSAFPVRRLTEEQSVELPRYSDKYRPSPTSQPTLKRKDFHQPFFPQEVFEDYFNPKKRKTGECLVYPSDGHISPMFHLRNVVVFVTGHRPCTCTSRNWGSSFFRVVMTVSSVKPVHTLDSLPLEEGAENI